MPSMSGMRMSVRSRSNAPPAPVSRSSPSAPSAASATMWPSSSRPRFKNPRTGSSSSTRRMRAIASCRIEQVPLIIAHDDADKGKLPIGMGDVHAVTDHEHVRAHEADEIGLDGDRPLAGLLEEHGGQNPARAARHQEILGEDESAVRFENVVDEEDVALAHRALDIAQDLDLAGRDRGGAVAREMDELDLGGEPRPMQGADEVRGE